MATREIVTKAEHTFRAHGARLERRAIRDGIRRELQQLKAGKTTVDQLRCPRLSPGLEWVMDWLSGRIQRTRKRGGVGRLVILLACLLLTPSAHASSVDWTQGFSTDYVAKVAGTNDLWNPGTYTFDASAANNHALWETSGDADGDGVMMLVNGKDDMADSRVWAKVLDLSTPFSLFAKNLCCIDHGGRIGPTLEFWLDGHKQADLVTDGPGVWALYSFATTAGRHLYEIRDGSSVFDGNDFALDAIGGAQTPEPLSLLLLGTGLSMAAWRRRKA